MKIIGEKLRIARQIRNKTITQLAKEVEISKQSISQFEAETAEPKGETIFKISRILDFPIQFFTIANKESICVSHTFFRALSSTSALEKNSYIEKTKLVTEIYDYLSEKLDLPQLNLYDLEIPDEINLESMEKLAHQVRVNWGLGDGPIWNVIGLLEENGIIVSVLKNDSSKIDAFTQIDVVDSRQRFCVMLESEKKSMPRRNFSAAHELGHIILHSRVPMNELDGLERSELETQANLFASCFLLPKETFKNDLKYPDEYDFYIELKKKWHVSIKAMIFRAHKLELINYEQYVSLLKKYNYRMARDNVSGERLEPLDNDILIDKPQLFKLAFDMLFENKIITLDTMRGEMANRGIALDEALICDVLPLDDNYFAKYRTNKEPLILKIRPQNN